MVHYVKRKRQFLRNGFLLPHDNARPQIAHCAPDVSQQNNVGILPHPPYSPDLTPCDFWLPQLKKLLILIKIHLGQIILQSAQYAYPYIIKLIHMEEDETVTTSLKKGRRYNHTIPCLNCGGGDRWCRNLSSLRRISPSLFVLSPVWCSRPTTGVLLAPCHDAFRGPRCDYVKQVALATTTTVK
ncbi:uncharacterized protein TNCV_1004721 [Trichonephila clavipes]|nr:uncharacterized protein TNCV_1004721 [Trichonephila clavipes]